MQWQGVSMNAVWCGSYFQHYKLLQSGWQICVRKSKQVEQDRVCTDTVSDTSGTSDWTDKCLDMHACTCSESKLCMTMRGFSAKSYCLWCGTKCVEGIYLNCLMPSQSHVSDVLAWHPLFLQKSTQNSPDQRSFLSVNVKRTNFWILV